MAVSSIGNNLRRLMRKIKSQVGFLSFIINSIQSHGEIALLYAEDLAVFCRPRLHRFKREKNKKTANVSLADSNSWFHLSTHNLQQLFVYWRAPHIFRHSGGHIYSSKTFYLIFLNHIKKGMPYTKMPRHTFEGDPRCL